MGESRRSFAIALTVAALMVGGSVSVGAAILAGGGPHDDMPMAVAPGGVVELSSLPPSVAAHYHLAADNPDVFERIPCFCGCDATLEHRSLLDCFVRPGGGWERHAAGCAVCLDESRIVRSMLARGSPARAIRSTVIDAYTIDA